VSVDEALCPCFSPSPPSPSFPLSLSVSLSLPLLPHLLSFSLSLLLSLSPTEVEHSVLYAHSSSAVSRGAGLALMDTHQQPMEILRSL
jgi:hypothetical protein